MPRTTTHAPTSGPLTEGHEVEVEVETSQTEFHRAATPVCLAGNLITNPVPHLRVSSYARAKPARLRSPRELSTLHFSMRIGAQQLAVTWAVVARNQPGAVELWTHRCA